MDDHLICKCESTQVESWATCTICLRKSRDYIIMETCLFILRGGDILQLPPEIAPNRNGAESIHFGYEYLTDYYHYWCHLLYEELPGEAVDKTPEPRTDMPTHGHRRYRNPGNKRISEFDPDDFLWE